jgi:hypothetical protein
MILDAQSRKVAALITTSFCKSPDKCHYLYSEYYRQSRSNAGWSVS